MIRSAILLILLLGFAATSGCSGPAIPSAPFYEVKDTPDGKEVIVHKTGGQVVSTAKVVTKGQQKGEGAKSFSANGESCNIEFKFDNTTTPATFVVSVKYNNEPVSAR